MAFGMSNTTLQTTRTIERILFTCAGAAIYNAIELSIAVFLRFRQRHGLYFWSLIISTLGIFPYTLGLLFKFFGVIQGYPTVFWSIALIVLGWQTMVTGQSVVLYSRLHLICHRPRILRGILAMIIINWAMSNIPTTVFVFGAASTKPKHYVQPYAAWERLQLSLYFVQEVVISSLYMYEVAHMLKTDKFSHDSRPKRRRESSTFSAGRKWQKGANRMVLKHLMWINVFIVLVDLSLLVTEFIGHYEVQVIYKGLVYSIKLKLEFRILNQLTDIAQNQLRTSQAYFSDRSQSVASEYTSPLASASSNAGLRRESDQSDISPLEVPGGRMEPIGEVYDLEKGDTGSLSEQRLRSLSAAVVRSPSHRGRPSLITRTVSFQDKSPTRKSGEDDPPERGLLK